jgi:predicted DCC family thiol-disulfide oxidoreductase YuxK
MTTTVLYDGDCGFCEAFARRLARRPAIVVQPIDTLSGAELLADLTPEERLASFHLVDPSGIRLSGGAAIPAVLRELPLGRLTARVASKFPRSVDRVYRLVARHRRGISRLLGQRACRATRASRERSD